MVIWASASNWLKPKGKSHLNNGRAYAALPLLFAPIAGVCLMFRIAVDVVLLPEEAMTDLTIALNVELVEKFSSKIVLSRKGCLPHISLAMGCIDSQNVARIGELLRPIIEIIPKRLKPAGIQKSTNFSGEVVSVFKVERSEHLQKLHEKICDTIKPFFTQDVTEDMIAGGHADASTLEWVRNYFIKSAHSNFSPHITVGYGNLTDGPLPRDFAVSRLAICHLGNHCTSAEILWSVKI
jgi:2'-5' RNA ligase